VLTKTTSSWRREGPLLHDHRPAIGDTLTKLAKPAAGDRAVTVTTLRNVLGGLTRGERLRPGENVKRRGESARPRRRESGGIRSKSVEEMQVGTKRRGRDIRTRWRSLERRSGAGRERDAARRSLTAEGEREAVQNPHRRGLPSRRRPDRGGDRQHRRSGGRRAKQVDPTTVLHGRDPTRARPEPGAYEG